MYGQHVLVKSLQIIETFNSVSVIATDKTGTLTQNKMTVTHLLWDIDGVYEAPMRKRKAEEENTIFDAIRRLSSDALDLARRLSDSTVKLARKLSSNSDDQTERIPLVNNDTEKSDVPPPAASEIRVQAFRDLLLGAALCNNAEKQMVKEIDINQHGINTEPKLQLVGDAADTALYHLCADQCSVHIEKVRSVNPRLKVLPFNSTNKFMISANQLETSDDSIPEKDRPVLIILKGAPDIVIQRCSTYKMSNNTVAPLDAETKKTLSGRQEELGKNGYRVIAMCQQKLKRQQFNDMIKGNMKKEESSSSDQGEDLSGFPSNDYCFIGLFSLLDPPRPEVPDAVSKARQAQIRVAMVTGDHPTTAKAIAKQVNILTTEIADTNGVDTFKLEKNSDGKSILNLYRNDNSIEQHEPGAVQNTDSLSENTKKMLKQAAAESGEAELEESAWHKRAWLSCRNQFEEPETDIEPTEKMEYIPYAIVVAGADINHMDDFMWDWVLSHQELVFARTSPEQKLRIVSEFQRRAEVVAVTGDGTNDAPALQCAHLGVAMQSGTEVSKEAGDMILLDNNFASIIQAIETGRLLSDNLKKVAIYLLPGGKLFILILKYIFDLVTSLRFLVSNLACLF
jgi:sodium/potassium-transporting ATPase subunit alpha